MKLVLDSNVFISAFLWGGNPKAVLDGVLDGRDQLFLSKDILDEIEEVLVRDKFQLDQRVIRLFLREMEDIGDLVVPSQPLDDILRDRDDHRILECAMEARADVLVTGDQDLLVLGTFRGIQILSPAQLLSLPRETT